ncbi:hypothetical protein HYX04_04795 [Candidatus Woesearchaeota archaeon]|nr:hypothetical protein [Candidatus Woesearchaeota archaeon]
MERITKTPIVINGKQVDVPLPQSTNRYFKLRTIGHTADGYSYVVVVYTGPAEQNGYKTLGREKQEIQPDEIYRLADDVTQLHLGPK